MAAKEVLDGMVYEKSSPLINHARINRSISKIFGGYSLSAQVYLDEKNQPIPDVMVFCNKDIVEGQNVAGVPDLIVEILSSSTLKRDRVYKKDLYERHGVKEYWIVDDERLSVEVYRLEGRQYVLYDIFVILPDHEVSGMNEGQIAEYPTRFKTSLFNDLTIDLKDVFQDVYENVFERS